MIRTKRHVRRPAPKRKTSRVLPQEALGYRAGYRDGYAQGEAAGFGSYSIHYDGTSIVIPARNQRKELERCLNGIWDHTDLPYEIIVVDAGSEDGTDLYLERLAGQIRCKRLEKGSGRAAAVNEGLKMAKGTTIAVLDSRSSVKEGWLAALLNALMSDERVGMAGPAPNTRESVQRPGAGGESAREGGTGISSGGSAWIGADSLGSFCIVFRRELWEKTGYWDERFDAGSFDVEDYCIRARLQGRKLLIANDADVRLMPAGESGGFGEGDAEAATANMLRFMNKWKNPNELLHYIQSDVRNVSGRPSDDEAEPKGESAFYPQGVAVKGIGRTVYGIDRNRRRPIEGECPLPVATVSNADLRRWERGHPIAAVEFGSQRAGDYAPHGLKTLAPDGVAYYLEYGIRRRILSDAASQAWGLDGKPEVPWTEDFIAELPEGLPIIPPASVHGSL
ncbi:glycosyltransferase family 2 protein [Paenibacillus thailandensis]|uniref:Glycosyltransferase family 2 protein n=1 Tax=Paenibacillus thailandensis TaxID=393250 RepID=A0ABW5QTE6_9BACL